MVVTMDTPGQLPSRSHIPQIRAEYGPARIWDHDSVIAIEPS